MKYSYIILLAVILGTTSCKHEKAQDTISETKMMSAKDLNEVGVILLEKIPFQKEIISNGKLTALQKSTLSFGVGEEIVQQNYKNGDYVEKEGLIASLNKETLENKLRQAKLQFEKASLDLEDILIGQGYVLADTATIPEELLHTAKLLSGYTSAKNELSTNRQSIHKSNLRAPFSGVLSGIEHNLHDRIGGSEDYCLLINNSSFLLSFDVLESEIEDISLNKAVEASPFSSDQFSYKGRIYEINPVVDEHGLIKIKALIESTSGLLEGMNMKVRVRTSIPNKLVVPKSAVLIRQNKDVVFKYSKGKAIWTYVQKEYENSTSYAILFQANSIGSLGQGDTIIVSGNLNLAHESEVTINF